MNRRVRIPWRYRRYFEPRDLSPVEYDISGEVPPTSPRLLRTEAERGLSRSLHQRTLNFLMRAQERPEYRPLRINTPSHRRLTVLPACLARDTTVRELGWGSRQLTMHFWHAGVPIPLMPLYVFMAWSALDPRIAHELIRSGVPLTDALQARASVPDGTPLLARSYPAVIAGVRPLDWIVTADRARLAVDR